MSNARAAKRRAKKDGEFQHGGAQIQLENPVANHFASFIVGNAQHCDYVPVLHSAVGQSLVICGAGPSLNDHLEVLGHADQVWGCNSAATWLHSQGRKITHGFTVDQTAHMVAEWYKAPPIDYLISSSCHPHLIEYLLSKGRRIEFFHNYVGLKRQPVAWHEEAEEATADPNCHHWWVGSDALMVCQSCGMKGMAYEYWLYNVLYPPTVIAGSGLNSVTRAVDLALYLGFDKITVLGADCALRLKSPPPRAAPGSSAFTEWLRDQTIMHANGDNALASGATAMTMSAEIDGRYWESKPDMIISAVWLVKMARALGDRFQILGDTLPAALMDKDETFLSRLPSFIGTDGKPYPVTFHLPDYYAPVRVPLPEGAPSGVSAPDLAACEADTLPTV